MRRRRQLTVLGLIVFLTLCAWSLIRIPAKRAAAEEARARKARDRATFPSEDGPRRYRRTPPEMRPKALSDKAVHPVLQLISEAEREMEKLKARQSKTLQQAVEEYKRRNNLPPPPHFDKCLATMRRRRQLTVVGLIVFLTLCAWSLIRIPANRAAAEEVRARKARDRATFPSEDGPRRYRRTPPEMRPKALSDKTVHPVLQLMSEAEREIEKLKARQSKTLQQAVDEYKRRNNLPPPPHFDKWFEFAKANGVQLVDEFDMINEMITPFWGLKPKTIRSRAKEALGHDNQLVMMLIRDHQVTHVQGAHTWQREATAGMVSKFIQYLPSMDLAFNIHDEPRVVLPHEDLARLINIAKNVNMPKANAAKWLKNKFSPKPREVGRGDGINEVKTTRFNPRPFSRRRGQL
ncbi:Beta-1 like protein [Verticillium longisporum]|nr:Beta-1 like protein [Verticillium longisporum]